MNDVYPLATPSSRGRPSIIDTAPCPAGLQSIGPEIQPGAHEAEGTCVSDDELRGRTPEERRNEIRRRLGAPSDEVLREPVVRPTDPRSTDSRATGPRSTGLRSTGLGAGDSGLSA